MSKIHGFACAAAVLTATVGACVAFSPRDACFDDLVCGHGLVCNPATNTCDPSPTDAGRTCTPDDTRCSENNLLRCKPDGSEWIVAEVCAGACIDGGCEPADGGIP